MFDVMNRVQSDWAGALSWHKSRKLRRKRSLTSTKTPSPASLSNSHEYTIPSHSIKMLRTVAVRALRASSARQVARQLTNTRPQSITSSFRFSPITPTFAVSSIRCYSAHAGLSKEEVQGRIMDLLKNFDKVCNSGVCPRGASITNRVKGYGSVEGILSC